jgi:hypothetical protein
MIASLIFFTTLFGTAAHAAVPPENPYTHIVRGKVFDTKEPAKLLFTFERTPFPNGESLKVTRSYKDSKGDLVAVEEIFYEKGKLQKFVVDQKQLNEKGGFEVRDGRLYFTYTKNGKT